jgi:trehalose 6-phosphate phosphatase
MDLMDRLACERALYVGDDETDEDAFLLAATRPVVTVRIGPNRGSRAEYFLNAQSEIDTLLQRLLALRPVTGSRGALA